MHENTLPLLVTIQTKAKLSLRGTKQSHAIQGEEA